MADTSVQPALTSAERAALVAHWDDFAHKMVRTWAKSIDRYGDEYEDAVQVARIGLLNAADRFRPELGYAFGTYAGHCCKSMILRWLKSRRPLGYRNDNRPPATHAMSSLAAPDDAEAFDVAAPPAEDPDVALDAAAVLELVGQLRGRDAAAVHAIYVEGLTGKESAARLGVSPTRELQLRRRGLRKLAELVRADGCGA